MTESKQKPVVKELWEMQFLKISSSGQKEKRDLDKADTIRTDEIPGIFCNIYSQIW